MKYKVWNPDDEGEDDAEVVHADSVADAAESWVAGVYSSAYPDSFDVMVADEDGKHYDCTVEVQWVPQYFTVLNKVRS